MAGEMVERLAKKHTLQDTEPEWFDAHDLAEARWWLNAIADELEQNWENLPMDSSAIALWLRTQAEENETPRARR